MILVGAGASVKAGIPSTAELGDVAKRALPVQHIPGTAYGTPPFAIPRSVQMADVLDSALRGTYENYDFEILLHALEQLETFNSRGYARVSGSNTPILGSFAELMRRYEILCDPNVIRQARHAATRAIHRTVGSASEGWGIQPSDIEAREQIKRMLLDLSERFRLIVVDFNYDDLVDQAPVEWNDGFTGIVPDRGCSLFSPTAWAKAIDDPTAHLLMHVHGSVRFGFKPQEALNVTTRFAEPAKYEQINAARDSVENRGVSGTTIDGQVYDADIIISGLGKAGKIAYNARPYGYYQRAISQFVPMSSRLLVLGYGWRDEHVNTWIDELIDLQRDRRCAVVTRRTGADVGDNTSTEYRRLNTLAGPNVWLSIESRAYAQPDPTYPTFFTEGNFAIAPAGFSLDASVESSILNFL